MKTKLLVRFFMLIQMFTFPMIAWGQIDLTIEGIDTTVSSYFGYDIPNSNKTTLIFRNSAVTSDSPVGFIVKAGEDDQNSYAYNLNGAIISGNKIRWNGTSEGTHGLMVGYSIDYDIKYNYFDSTKYGIVHEGGMPGSITMDNHKGGISYNIIKDCYMGIIEKGFANTGIYNNTFYTSVNTLFFIAVKSSDTGGHNSISKNIKIKNNVFYSTQKNPAIRLGSAGDDSATEMDTSGFECDYNVYYYTNTKNNEPVFLINDTTVTWSEWRALGYDQHSVIADPEFMDTDHFIPSTKLYFGTNLGDEFENGLEISAEWVVGSSPATTNQDSVWQAGAKIYACEPSVSIQTNKSNPLLLSYYPNPTNGNLNIEYHIAKTGSITIEVVNMLGQIIHKESIDVQANGKNKTEIKLPQVEGIYNVRISDGQSPVVKSVIIESA